MKSVRRLAKPAQAARPTVWPSAHGGGSPAIYPAGGGFLNTDFGMQPELP
jgi:hypothetical protein